jgi:excisionase family DNA binding protein
MATTKPVNPICVRLEEAAAMIAVAPRTLRKWASEGRIRSVKLGSRLLFRVADLEQLLKNNERPARESRPRSVSAGERAKRALQEVSAALRGPVN